MKANRKREMKILLKLFGLVGLGVCLGALQAQADPIQLVCTGSTMCTPGGIMSTGSTSPTFELSFTGNPSSGEAFLIVLLPNSDLLAGDTGVNGSAVEPGEPVSFTSGSVWDALGETGGTDHNFSTYQGFAEAAGAGTITGFQAYDFDIGAFGPSVIPVTFSCGGGSCGPFPTGTIFLGFVENGSGQVILATPNSESLIVSGGGSPVPEPASLSLLGMGLFGLGIGSRRRFRTNAARGKSQ